MLATYELEMTTLGMRDLQSTWGIHKSQVSFALPEGTEITTQLSNLPSRKNPNFVSHSLSLSLSLSFFLSVSLFIQDLSAHLYFTTQKNIKMSLNPVLAQD